MNNERELTKNMRAELKRNGIVGSLSDYVEETGVWTIEACEDVDVFDEGTIEYGILHGGISFADINYKEFNKAMINIDSELHKGTTDPRDMHDFLEEAALKEATNDYE